MAYLHSASPRAINSHSLVLLIPNCTRNHAINYTNGRLAALFPEVTHEEFLRRELEYTVGFDREGIQLSLISPWEKFVAYQ